MPKKLSLVRKVSPSICSFVITQECFQRPATLYSLQETTNVAEITVKKEEYLLIQIELNKCFSKHLLDHV